MTKQNVVVGDAGSGLNMAITAAVSGSSHKPPVVPYVNTLSKNKLILQNLEINTWVDSMRASSPTHDRIKSTDHQDSWTVDHPSALDMVDEIINCSEGKQIVMFLDYDGTLSPIVNDPDQAFMSKAMRSTVRKVAGYFPTAIVSGRCRDKVYNFVRLGELYYAGSHGMDIKGPSKPSKYNKIDGTGDESQSVLFQPATEFLPIIDEVYKELLDVIKSTPGAKVENNKFCLSVHFRCVDDTKWRQLAKRVGFVLIGYPNLRLTQGRKVLEIRPTIKWDKGKALEFLLESLGYDNCMDLFPIYIGDDRTDEDAFKVLRERGEGIGILVSKTPKDTNASYSLQDPSEVMSFLRRLVEWKRIFTKKNKLRKSIDTISLS